MFRTGTPKTRVCRDVSSLACWWKIGSLFELVRRWASLRMYVAGLACKSCVRALLAMCGQGFRNRNGIAVAMPFARLGIWRLALYRRKDRLCVSE